MEIQLLSRNKQVKQKVESDHYWYDHITKITWHGRGGRMEYVYNAEEKRMLPRIVDSECYVSCNNYQDISRWVAKNSKKYGIEIESDTGKNITISLDAYKFDDVVRDLYDSSINFDFDNNQLRRELERRYGKIKR